MVVFLNSFKQFFYYWNSENVKKIIMSFFNINSHYWASESLTRSQFCWKSQVFESLQWIPVLCSALERFAWFEHFREAFLGAVKVDFFAISFLFSWKTHRNFTNSIVKFNFSRICRGSVIVKSIRLVSKRIHFYKTCHNLFVFLVCGNSFLFYEKYFFFKSWLLQTNFRFFFTNPRSADRQQNGFFVTLCFFLSPP